ncbi:MAG: hypothetical protein ABJH72_14265 [Reichenbachiella sp.]|uniref:hypothetical protein n=1 Tax=Reichenbachiella sp. TaxID=2184521 RepID=UPI0032678B1F
MGYMGFGMRKEVYTRKPKKVFTKLKEMYGQKLVGPNSATTTRPLGSVSYEKHSYKPFYQTRFYKILKRTVLSVLAISLIWTFFIQEHFEKYLKIQFEAKGFSELYQTEMSHLTQLFETIDARRNKMISIRYYPWSKDYDIRIKHPLVHEAMNPADIHFSRFDGGSQNFRKPNDDTIDEHILILKRETSIIHEENWVYAMNNVVASQVPSSIVRYLEMDEVEFLEFLAIVAKLGEEIEIEASTIKTGFEHKIFGYYEIKYSTYELKSSVEIRSGLKYKKLIGTLADNVYWSRSERMSF